MNWYYRSGDAKVGPMTWERLVECVRDGAVGPGDMVWREGMAAWQQAVSVPGLIPMPGQAPAGPGVPPPPASLGDNAAIRMVIPVGRSGWAIAAGYLGLISILLFPAPFALGTGIYAIIDIRRNPHKHGMGRAIFGIVMGGLGTIALLSALVGLLIGASRF
jgi:hypothetical protein